MLSDLVGVGECVVDDVAIRQSVDFGESRYGYALRASDEIFRNISLISISLEIKII